MYKKTIVRVILATWIIIWVIFLVRPYFKKGLLDEYGSLLKLSTEGKRAYVTGKDLYAFVGFCRKSVNKPSTYRVVGLEKDSIEHRRFKYYLYPCIEKDDPEYIFVYDTKDFMQNGYRMFSRMNSEEYILRKTN